MTDNLTIVSWCPGDPCDPCVGNLEVYGNNGDQSHFPPADKIAICYARGSITNFPQFPATITATISLEGIYRPFVGEILSPGGGSVTISGTGDSIAVPCPFPSAFFQTPAGWTPGNPAGDMLLFHVVATCTTTSAPTLEITSITALLHTESGIVNVWDQIRWTGAVE